MAIMVGGGFGGFQSSSSGTTFSGGSGLGRDLQSPIDSIDSSTTGTTFSGGATFPSKSNDGTSTSSTGITSHPGSERVWKTVGTAVLSGVLGKQFNKVIGKLTGQKQQDYSMEGAPIDIPGTLMGNLKNVQGTKTYLNNYARYNNYLTCNLGMAQMASDRYMSIKERIPMSFEYYETPKKKKEVVMYINPENMTISTSKIKQKVITRGGIYFHHYGDDVWSMKLSGTVGYAQMRGIEALEEIYFHSGALLKYNNIAVDTVHTNKITSATSSSISDRLEELRKTGPIGNYLAKVIGTATDALGYTQGKDGKSDNSLVTKLGKHGGLLGKIFNNKKSSEQSGKELFACLANSSKNLQDGINNKAKRKKAGGISRKEVQELMAVGSLITGKPTQQKAMFNSIFANLKNTMGNFCSKSILGAIAADMTETLSTGKSSNQNMMDLMGVLNSGTKDFFQSTLDVLTGHGSDTDTGTSIAPSSAINGNYYSFDINSRMDLNNVVRTVASYGADHTIDKKQAYEQYKDLEGELTDRYRPRQIIMYFDDRVYIGHFDSFNYSRKATTPLIYYDMTFTITRQIKITPKSLYKNKNKSSLGDLLGMMVAGQVFGGFGDGTDTGSSSNNKKDRKKDNSKGSSSTTTKTGTKSSSGIDYKDSAYDSIYEYEKNAQYYEAHGETSRAGIYHEMAHQQAMLKGNGLNYSRSNVNTAEKLVDDVMRGHGEPRSYDLKIKESKIHED